MEFLAGEIFAGPDHALHEITLHPAIKRGVPVSERFKPNLTLNNHNNQVRVHREL